MKVRQKGTSLLYYELNLNFCMLVLKLEKVHIDIYRCMREGKNLRRMAVSEWRHCYIDYEYLKIFIDLLMSIVNQYMELQESHEGTDGQQQKASQQTSDNERIVNINETQKQKISRELKVLADKVNQLFIQAFQIETQVCQIFCRLKFKQVKYRFQLALQYEKIANKDEKTRLLIRYTEYTYIESSFLKKMEASNIEAERKILKKHKKYSQKLVNTPKPVLENILQPKQIKDLIDRIENFYVDFTSALEAKSKKKKKKVKRDYIRSIKDEDEASNTDSFVFGLWVGIFLTIIIFMSILLDQHNKTVENDPTFNRDFPPWRGIALIIFYIWVFAIDVACFEFFMISYRNVMDFDDNNYSNSTSIFKIAGFLSTLFAILFSIYALSLGELIVIFMPVQYLALIVWGMLLFLMFNPLPFFRFHGRVYTIKLFLKIAVSPLIGVSFAIAWATDQLVSLIIPFEDLLYTICYYSSTNFSEEVSQVNVCKQPAKLGVFIYATIILSYRIMQCARQGFDKKKFLFQLQFFNSLKYVFSLITLMLSYLWTSVNRNIFAAWLTFAIASTIYSYVWDLKVDWDLLHCNSNKCLLRKKLFYSSSKFYYAMMVLNLILRLAWVLTLSPNIASDAFGSPELFRLITGSLEILRRGIWNLFRVEKDHVRNADEFKAIPKARDRYEKQIVAKIEDKKGNMNTVDRIIEEEGDQIVNKVNRIQMQKREYDQNLKGEQNREKMGSFKQLREKLDKLHAHKKQVLKIVKGHRKQTNRLIKQIKSLQR